MQKNNTIAMERAFQNYFTEIMLQEGGSAASVEAAQEAAGGDDDKVSRKSSFVSYLGEDEKELDCEKIQVSRKSSFVSYLEDEDKDGSDQQLRQRVDSSEEDSSGGKPSRRGGHKVFEWWLHGQPVRAARWEHCGFNLSASIFLWDECQSAAEIVCQETFDQICYEPRLPAPMEAVQGGYIFDYSQEARTHVTDPPNSYLASQIFSTAHPHTHTHTQGGCLP